MTMRTVLKGLAILALTSFALGQEAPNPEPSGSVTVDPAEKTAYVGATVGVASVIVFSVIPISVHAGFGLDDYGGRVDALYYVGGTGVQLGVNGLIRGGPPLQGNTSGYGGGGPRLIIGSGGIGFGLGALGGLEYFVNAETGIFGEARLDLLFAGGFTLPLIGLAVGANFYF